MNGCRRTPQFRRAAVGARGSQRELDYVAALPWPRIRRRLQRHVRRRAGYASPYAARRCA